MVLETETPVVEDSLADRIRAGDKEAEGELAERFRRRVFVMAFAKTRDPEASEDLAHEVILAVIQNLREGRLVNGEKLDAYIHGTARNLINNHFRVRARARFGAMPADPKSEQRDPEQVAADRERLALIRQALRELKPQDREILRWTLVEGLKPAEIADRTGLSSEVVRKRKSRACQKLQNVIQDTSQNPGGDHSRGENR
jgi:RNA polymerase sigma-70 factor (ECF subfamily)